jgi:phospholipase C
MKCILRPLRSIMDTRRDFLKKASLLSGGAGLLNVLPPSIARAMAINPEAGTTFLDAEHVVLLMQENRSFDHTYGTLQGVRGYNDPRAITIPGKKPVWFQSNSNGETYAPFRLDIKNTNATWMESLPHSWQDQVDARNNGRFDKWLDNKYSHVDKYRAMPLTLGFYTREDIPFYYSMADAFTVCDQNFCSSLTGTTPNRLYFWTGTIREKQDENALARVWNDDADEDTPVSWTTYPERLEDNDISWKIYQNEVSIGSGLKDEADDWLSNFTDNPIEFFTQYHVKSKAGDLSGREKSIHEKAFTTNKNDPHYHDLDTLKYKDGDVEREMKVPKGDILYQFREDVNKGKLPMVSWIVAPAKFSDHPSSPWYGAWYISEVLDILTKDPKVWKKTVLILTYDENDGYFDHVPPFVAPHPNNEGTGKVSKGIDTGVEYVASAAQQTSEKEDVRNGPIGLGYRVPMVIASPWSRGGWVNSQVFDHTSSLQFLEKFLLHKTGKKIEETNISSWRRTICGDLTSVFRPYNGEKLKKLAFLDRDEFVKSIHKAQFRNVPSNFKKLSEDDLDQLKQGKDLTGLLPKQEKGIRDATALPYELNVYGWLDKDRKTFFLDFEAGNKLFGKSAAGAPFTVYAPGKYKNEEAQNWSYAVSAGDNIMDSWKLEDFDNNHYHLRVYGPNGFFREFKGTENDVDYEVSLNRMSSKMETISDLTLQITNLTDQVIELELTDNSYNTGNKTFSAAPGNAGAVPIRLDLSKSYGWYDFSLKIKGQEDFEKRYAGRVENGNPGKTDPAMGG